MAKKASLKTDWKFVFLAASLILLAISIWAVSTKMNTTSSQAAGTDPCRTQLNECKKSCNEPVCQSSNNGQGQNCWRRSSEAKRNCISSCNEAFRQCHNPPNQNAGNQNPGGGPQQTEKRTTPTPTPTQQPVNR